MPDYKLQTIYPEGAARPDLTFTKAECLHCTYVSQRGYAGYAEASVKEHLKKHGINQPERSYERRKQ